MPLQLPQAGPVTVNEVGQRKVVSAEGEGHFLRMVDGHEVLLTVIPDGRLHWQALTPNDDFTCKPLR